MREPKVTTEFQKEKITAIMLLLANDKRPGAGDIVIVIGNQG
jgi:hypothetical protein